ncbi:hypothetical protein C8R44DRAFT_738451 [Mycena epipterygia]|nr:hypothetical protein C8R44DRAFT_738451 [Mycena epipterygia]
MCLVVGVVTVLAATGSKAKQVVLKTFTKEFVMHATAPSAFPGHPYVQPMGASSAAPTSWLSAPLLVHSRVASFNRSLGCIKQGAPLGDRLPMYGSGWQRGCRLFCTNSFNPTLMASTTNHTASEQALLHVVAQTKLFLAVPRVRRLVAISLMGDSVGDQDINDISIPEDLRLFVDKILSDLPQINLMQGLSEEARVVKSEPSSLKNIHIDLRAERVWYLATLDACVGTSHQNYRKALGYIVVVLAHAIMRCLPAAVSQSAAGSLPASLSAWETRTRGQARDWFEEKLTGGCCIDVTESPSTLRHKDVPVPENCILQQISQVYARAAVQGGFHIWYLESVHCDSPDLFASVVAATTPDDWAAILQSIEEHIVTTSPEFTDSLVVPPVSIVVSDPAPRCEVLLYSEASRRPDLEAYLRWRELAETDSDSESH